MRIVFVFTLLEVTMTTRLPTIDSGILSINEGREKRGEIREMNRREEKRKKEEEERKKKEEEDTTIKVRI